MFKEISSSLKSADIDYFEELAVGKRINMLVTCEMDFDVDLSLATSMDLGMFPHFDKISANDCPAFITPPGLDTPDQFHW